MFVVGRQRGGTDEEPEESFTMVGTIGNVYEVTVAKLPSCTCPDSLNGKGVSITQYQVLTCFRESLQASDLHHDQGPESTGRITVSSGPPVLSTSPTVCD